MDEGTGRSTQKVGGKAAIYSEGPACKSRRVQAGRVARALALAQQSLTTLQSRGASSNSEQPATFRLRTCVLFSTQASISTYRSNSAIHHNQLNHITQTNQTHQIHQNDWRQVRRQGQWCQNQRAIVSFHPSHLVLHFQLPLTRFFDPKQRVLQLQHIWAQTDIIQSLIQGRPRIPSWSCPPSPPKGQLRTACRCW